MQSTYKAKAHCSLDVGSEPFPSGVDRSSLAMMWGIDILMEVPIDVSMDVVQGGSALGLGYISVPKRYVHILVSP